VINVDLINKVRLACRTEETVKPHHLCAIIEHETGWTANFNIDKEVGRASDFTGMSRGFILDCFSTDNFTKLFPFEIDQRAWNDLSFFSSIRPKTRLLLSCRSGLLWLTGQEIIGDASPEVIARTDLWFDYLQQFIRSPEQQIEYAIKKMRPFYTSKQMKTDILISNWLYKCDTNLTLHPKALMLTRAAMQYRQKVDELTLRLTPAPIGITDETKAEAMARETQERLQS